MEQDNLNNIINNHPNNLNNNKVNNDHQVMISDSKGGNFPCFPAKRSIAERRGFNYNAARINTARFRITTTSPLSSPSSPSGGGRSPRLTIPPGISPTALLDSPVMLPNSQAMPSPTTGSLHWLNLEQGNASNKFPVSDDSASSSKSKPHEDVDPNPLPPYSTSQNQVSSNCNLVKEDNTECQPLVSVQPSLDFPYPTDIPKGHPAKHNAVHSYNEVKMAIEANDDTNNNVEMAMSLSDEASDESALPKTSVPGEEIGLHPVTEGDQKDRIVASSAVRTSEDGYNWRKYGQKQVKGSEYPRSYYKCTQPNCQVKKKVERSHDGQITEIIYKGVHNHAKPHLSRRASAIPTEEISDMVMAEASETCAKIEGAPLWRNVQTGGVKDIDKQILDWKADGQERTSPTSGLTDLSDPISANKAKSLCNFESEDTPELSSTLASHDADEDGATQAIVSVEDDAEDDESDSKRRKKESYLVESNLSSRAVREPRVVVQIESEVDILDDGYRWRKYGQKVVKGNPNPRSYYKCTSAGCPVRKHVERASHNLKFVITTYEGKHNHEVPTARTNNHISSSDTGLSSGGANGQMALTLPGSSGIPKHETNHHSLASHHFDRKPDISNEFLRSSLVGSFSNDMKFTSSPLCQMKYPPPLNNTMPYGSYGLNPDRCAPPQAGSMAPVFHDFPMPLPLNLPSSASYPLAGLNFNCVKPIGPVHQSYLSGQVKDIDTGFLRPKQEQKDDSLYSSSCIPQVDHHHHHHHHHHTNNASSLTPPQAASPSIYQRVMQNFHS